MNLDLPILDCFQDCFEPLTEADVCALERDIGIRLPDDFRQFLLKYNAAYCNHDVSFRVRNPGPFVDEGGLMCTLGVVSDEEFSFQDIRSAVDCYRGRIPGGLVPIAVAYSDKICIATTPEEYGKVYFWDRVDEGADDNLYLIADSFSEFLTRLYRASEDEDYVEQLPIFQAVERGELATVQTHLDEGGKPDCRNGEGHTLLMCAARTQWPKIVRLLLEHRADPNALDADGFTPLYHAVMSDSHDSCKLLLAAGADAQWCDDRGRTLYKIAWEHDSSRTAYTLEEHLAKPHPSHKKAARSEEAFASNLHANVPNEVVLLWGKKQGTHGADVVSYNLETKVVTLWDDKFRSASVRGKPSRTFEKDTGRLAGALEEAKDAINRSKLSPADKQAAFESIDKGTYILRMHPSGNARSPITGDPP